MSEQAKKSGMSRFFKPAAMAGLMVGIAALGALGSSFLQRGKTLTPEENHVTTSDEPQSPDANHTVAEHSDSTSSEVVHSDISEHSQSKHSEPTTRRSRSKSIPTEHDPFSEEALGATSESDGADDSSGTHGIHRSHEPEDSHESHGGSADDLNDADEMFDSHSEASAEDSLVQHGHEGHASDDHGVSGHAGDHSLSEMPEETHSSRSSERDHADDLDASHPLSSSYAERSEESSRKQKKSSSTHPRELSGVASRTDSSRHEKVTQQAVNLMALADEDLAGGNYVQAMQAYQALRQKSDGVPGTAVLFRLALCAEASGRHAAAIEAYRKISGTQADPAWAGVARYGEARCLSVMKRHVGLQTDLLRRAILDETEFLPTVRGEVLHLIGRDLWREQTAIASTDLLDDQTLIVPEWSADPARMLDELPLLIHETPRKAGPVEFQVLKTDDASPDGIVVRLSCGMTRVEALLKNLIAGCRLKYNLSEPAAELLQGRTQQIHVTEQTLALLLDGITVSSGLAWTLQDSEVRIAHPDELSPADLRRSRLDAAERILRMAVMDVPGSPQAGHSRLALSTLLFEQKRAADAVQFLQVQIESSPRSVVETEAAFNLGKCLMILDQRDESKQAFLRSIDASGGLIDVKIASYILHSRLLLEDDQGKRAIQSMMRGLSLSEGSDLEPFAALHLASLYLMTDSPQGANTVLMERREELAEGPGRDAAAFLSSFARFRAAVLADHREREGATVVSALTKFSPADYCGGHWALLAADACDELGLAEQATEDYLLALKKLPQSHLRNTSILRIAARYQAENQLEQARLMLASLTSAEADQITIQARLRSAELALQQDRPDEAIVACRKLIDSAKSPDIERDALRIMGQAYERQLNHQAAIYCFAGMLPDEQSPAGSAPGSDGHPDKEEEH